MQVPTGIDVDQYKTQAKELLKNAQLAHAEALARFRTHHPQRGTQRKSSLAPATLKLADAQLVIAREHGFASWPRFVEYLRFRNAVAALDRGDRALLETLIAAHPSVLRYECRVGEWYEDGYFAGATLLWHIAGNPNRGPLAPNIVDIARLLIDRHFTKADAHTTIALLLTSKQASEAGVTLPLLDLLTNAGAQLDLNLIDTLDDPLLNHAPEAARALIGRGARVHLRHAAALGDRAAMAFALSQPVSQHDLDEALLFACIRDQREAAALLLSRGAKGDALLAPGSQTPRTALHEAANRGYGEVVELLLASSASPLVLDARWAGTASGWAEAGGHTELAARLRVHEAELRARE